MNDDRQYHYTESNHRLIAQVAEYYNEAKVKLDLYRELGYPTLADLTQKHLLHWKNQLHNLIFNSSTGDMT